MFIRRTITVAAWLLCAAQTFGIELATNQLGVRPFYLLDKMEPGGLQRKLQRCAEKKSIYRHSDFSIAHRGAPLQFPEHSKDSYLAGIRQGAGLIECDVTFTADKQLVCRHAQCDLHETTNILVTPLSNKCRGEFKPFDPTSKQPATAQCCTSDLTLTEYKQLCAKMEGTYPYAGTPEEFIGGTLPWRTELYSDCSAPLSHEEYIDIVNASGRGFIPELKAPEVEMPFKGLSREGYARMLVDAYKSKNIPPERVVLQSFAKEDLKVWQQYAPKYAARALLLDSRVYTDKSFTASFEGMKKIKDEGINYIGPPMQALLKVGKMGELLPSDYAVFARRAGLKIMTWSFERSGSLSSGGGWYFNNLRGLIKDDGDAFVVLDALYRKAQVIGVFSDWPATTTFFANCATDNVEVSLK